MVFSYKYIVKYIVKFFGVLKERYDRYAVIAVSVSRKKRIPTPILLGVFLALFATCSLLTFTHSTPATSELAFIEHTEWGMGSVIPASCESNPSNSYNGDGTYDGCTQSRNLQFWIADDPYDGTRNTSVTVASGDSVKLNWFIGDADWYGVERHELFGLNCTASGDWSGTKSDYGEPWYNGSAWYVSGTGQMYNWRIYSWGRYFIFARQGDEIRSAITSSKTYTLTCSLPGGFSETKSVTVNVPTSVPPSADLKINGSDGPVTVSPTDDVKIEWCGTPGTPCANADTCAVTHTGGTETWTSLQGEKHQVLAAARTYTLTCSNAGGSQSDSVTVSVLPAGTPAADLKVNGSDGPIAILAGRNVTVDWCGMPGTPCANADSCAVTFSDAGGGWSGSTSGTHIQALSQTRTYSLTCTRSGVSSADTATVNVCVPPQVVSGSACAGGNGAPTVYAGTDRSVVQPSDSASAFEASASDAEDGVPVLLWTSFVKPAGASDPVITSPASLTPIFSGLTAIGTYVFKLTGTDSGGLTAEDSMNVVVIAPQCSDGIDNADAEDPLADALDPGCHSDADASNNASYVPTDDDETNDGAVVPPCPTCPGGSGGSCAGTAPPSGALICDATLPSGSYTQIPACSVANDRCDYVIACGTGYVESGGACVRTQCSNNADDGDSEDILIDEADPGCHSDGNKDNPASYDENDNNETDSSGSEMTLTASPRIVEQGSNTRLIWTLGGRTGCSLTGGSLKSTDLAQSGELLGDLDIGSFELTPVTALTTYTLSCPGNQTKRVTVEIIPKQFES